MTMPYDCARCGRDEQYHTGEEIRLYGGEVTFTLLHDYVKPDRDTVIQRMRANAARLKR